MKSKSYTNIRKSVIVHNLHLKDGFVCTITDFLDFTDSSNQKSCFLSFFTNPYIQNHFKVNVFLLVSFPFSGC